MNRRHIPTRAAVRQRRHLALELERRAELVAQRTGLPVRDLVEAFGEGRSAAEVIDAMGGRTWRGFRLGRDDVTGWLRPRAG